MPLDTEYHSSYYNLTDAISGGIPEAVSGNTQSHYHRDKPETMRELPRDIVNDCLSGYADLSELHSREYGIDCPHGLIVVSLETTRDDIVECERINCIIADDIFTLSIRDKFIAVYVRPRCIECDLSDDAENCPHTTERENAIIELTSFLRSALQSFKYPV